MTEKIRSENPAPSASNPNQRLGMDSYFEKFGGRLPRSVLKFSVDTGQMEKLDQMLQERVDSNQQVTDWDQFVEPLVKPFLKPS